jgi:hypothetical protein
MSDNLMILPADKHEDIRLIKIPDDFEEHEAYRYVTVWTCWRKEVSNLLNSYWVPLWITDTRKACQEQRLQ